MQISKTTIDGVLILEPKIFEDSRGYFFESYNQKKFNLAHNQDYCFVQDNQSISSRGTLRGIHFQIEPMAQAKLIQVLEGEIYDVAVDLRKDSKTYCQWVSVKLSSFNHHQLFIPEGFGHAFLTISDTAKIMYKVSKHYSKEHEKVIRYDDPKLNIEWPLDDIKLSIKDKNAGFISDSIKYF